MRRIAALFAVFLALLGLASQAHAVTRGGVHWVERDWLWHTTTDPALGLSYDRGDSSFRLRGSGLQASDEQKDTTRAIAWADWAFPGALYGTTTASDTIGIMVVDVYADGTTPTVAADTIGVTIQVSDDNGTSWTTCAATGPRIDPDVAAMGASAWVETGTSNSFHVVIEQTVGGATLGGPLDAANAAQGTPLALNTFGYQMFRLIVRGDHTGKYRIRIKGWQYDDAP
jgi:hypothetical protein